MLWRTCWETQRELEEPERNLLGIQKELSGEHIGNEGNMKKNPSPHKLKTQKSKAHWVHAWAFPLITWKFSSERSLSPFLAWGKISLAKNTLPTYWGRKKQWPGSNSLSTTQLYNSEEEQERLELSLGDLEKTLLSWRYSRKGEHFLMCWLLRPLRPLKSADWKENKKRIPKHEWTCVSLGREQNSNLRYSWKRTKFELALLLEENKIRHFKGVDGW